MYLALELQDSLDNGINVNTALDFGSVCSMFAVDPERFEVVESSSEATHLLELQAFRL